MGFWFARAGRDPPAALSKSNLSPGRTPNARRISCGTVICPLLVMRAAFFMTDSPIPYSIILLLTYGSAKAGKCRFPVQGGCSVVALCGTTVHKLRQPQNHHDTKRRLVRRSNSHGASDLPAAAQEPLVRTSSSQGRPSESQTPGYRGKLISRPDPLLSEARCKDSSHCWYE